MESLQRLQEVHQAGGGDFRLREAHAGEMARQGGPGARAGDPEAGRDAADEAEAPTGAHRAASAGGVEGQPGVCDRAGVR